MTPTPEMIEAAKAKGRVMAGNQPGALVEAFAEVAAAGAVAALALISGEPVGWIWKLPDGDEWQYRDGSEKPDSLGLPKATAARVILQPVYAAPAPLPVAVKELAEKLELELKHLDDLPPSIQSQANIRLINAARALIRSALSSPVGGMEERTATVADCNAAFDPADEAFGGAFRDGFREGWLFAKSPDFEDREDAEEDYPREVDMAPTECWDAYRSHYFAKLPLAAIPEVGSVIFPASDIAALREENDSLFWMRLGARAMRLSARAACGNHWESSQEDAMTSEGLSKLDKEKLYAEANASEEISRVISEKCEDSALGYASYMGDEADRKLLADHGVTSDWLYRRHTGEPSRKELSDGSALQHVAKGER